MEAHIDINAGCQLGQDDHGIRDILPEVGFVLLREALAQLLLIIGVQEMTGNKRHKAVLQETLRSSALCYAQPRSAESVYNRQQFCSTCWQKAEIRARV